MTDGTTTWTYNYDANGMRTSRSNGTTTYEYIYNGSQLAQMTVGNDTLYFTSDTVTYNGTVYYYVTNLQGDVTAIINSSGALAVLYTYDAWGNIPADGQFPVKGHCLNSQLMSVSDCQAIIKKAASRRLGEKYGVTWLPETGVKFQLHFTILNDQVTLSLDTSGNGLHKRGYRAIGNDAPLHETLAAGMIQLTKYRGREFFWDPFCGSGTICIEAALIAKNRAPGLNRSFAAENYPWMPKSAWELAKTEARDKEFNGDYRIMGSDNDPACVSLSFANARKAGVADCVTFKDGDATKMSLPAESGIIVSNPPYGERMLEQNSARGLYSALGRHLKFANDWKKFIITSEPEFEHYFGKRADKKRKFYNGKIKCDLYMFTDNTRRKK